jgi:hypothetical protein
MISNLIITFKKKVDQNNRYTTDFIMNYITFNHSLFDKVEKGSFSTSFNNIRGHLSPTYETGIYSQPFGIPVSFIWSQEKGHQPVLVLNSLFTKFSWIRHIHPKTIVSSLVSGKEEYREILSYILSNEESFPSILIKRLKDIKSKVVDKTNISIKKITNLFEYKVFTMSLDEEYTEKKFSLLVNKILGNKVYKDPRYYKLLFISSFIEKYGFDILKDKPNFLHKLRVIASEGTYKPDKDLIPNDIKKKIFTDDFDKLLIVSFHKHLGNC